MTPSQSRLDTAAKRVARLLPPNTQERVANAYRYWNVALRSQIGSETRLQLGGRESQSRIAVEVCDGFPRPLAEIVEQIDLTLWRLALGQNSLLGLAQGATFVTEHWDELLEWPHMPSELQGSQPALQATLRLAEKLRALVTDLRLEVRIAAVHEDILGCYDSENHTIGLYWISIGMFASLLGCSVEDLTGVVLAHELAHAYTHLGQDVDGQVWDRQAFAAADLEITEGLAQFYTALVANSRMVSQRSLGFSRAFRNLLAYQAEPYHVHMHWGEEEAELAGERVRLAMLACRKRGVTRYSDFRRLLAKSAGVLGASPRSSRRRAVIETLPLFTEQP